MAKITDIEITSLLFDEQGSAPATPSSTNWRLFFKSDGLYIIDDTGAVTGPFVTAGSSGIASGTSNPGSPSSGDMFFRTDMGLVIYYDGTRWLSTQLLKSQMVMRGTAAITTQTGDLTGTTANGGGMTRAIAPSVVGASDIWLVDHAVTFIVNSGGTALGASHKWVGTLVGFDTNTASTGTKATVTIDSGSSAVYRRTVTTIGALQAAGTLYYGGTWSKTGSPGTLTLAEEFTYRIVVA